MNYLIIINIIISLYVFYKIIIKYLDLLKYKKKNPNFINKAKSAIVPEIIESKFLPESTNINQYSFTLWFWLTDSNYKTSSDKNLWKHILHKGDPFANKCQPAIWLNTKTNQLIILYDLVERSYSYNEFKKNLYYYEPFQEKLDNKTLGSLKKKCNSISNCKGISLACENIKDPCSRCHHGLFKTDLNEKLQHSKIYIENNIPLTFEQLQKNYKDIGTLFKSMNLPSMNPNINPKIINHPHLIKTINNFPIGRWVHLGITCNSSSSNIYIDGVLIDTISFPCNIQMNNNNLYINTLNNGFSGLISQVRYFEKSITQNKIYEIYTWGPKPYTLPDINKFNFVVRAKSIFNNIIDNSIKKNKETSEDFIKWYKVDNKVYRYNITKNTYKETNNYQNKYNIENMLSLSDMINEAHDINKIYKDVNFSTENRALLIKLIRDKIPNYYKHMSFTNFDKHKLKLIYNDFNNIIKFGTYDSDLTDGIDKCGIKKLPVPIRHKFKCPEGKIIHKDGIQCDWPPCKLGMNQDPDTGICSWPPCPPKMNQNPDTGECKWPPCPNGMNQDPVTGKCSWPSCRVGMIQNPETGKCTWPPCPTGMNQDPDTGKCTWPACPTGMNQDPDTGKCTWPPCPTGMNQDTHTGKCTWPPCPTGMNQDLDTGKCNWPTCPTGMNQNPDTGICSWIPCPTGMKQDPDTGKCKWPPCPNGMNQDNTTGECTWPPCPNGMKQDPDTGKCTWAPCPNGMNQDPNTGKCNWPPCPNGMNQDPDSGKCTWPQCPAGMKQDLDTGKCTWLPCPPDMNQDKDTGECTWPPCPAGMNQNLDTGKCTWSPCPPGMKQDTDTGKCTWLPCPTGMKQNNDTGKCTWPPCPQGMIQNTDYGKCTWPPCPYYGMNQDLDTGECKWPPCPTGMNQDPDTGKCTWPSCPTGMKQDTDTGKCSWKDCPTGMNQDPDTGKCSWPPCPPGMNQNNHTGECSWPPCSAGMNQDNATGKCSWPTCPTGMNQDPATGKCSWPPCPTGMNQDSATGKCTWPPCPSIYMIQNQDTGICTWIPCPSGMNQDPNTGDCSMPRPPPPVKKKKFKCPDRTFIYRDSNSIKDKTSKCWSSSGKNKDIFNCKTCCKSLNWYENNGLNTKALCWAAGDGKYSANKKYGYVHPKYGSTFYQCCKGLLKNLTKENSDTTPYSVKMGYINN